MENNGNKLPSMDEVLGGGNKLPSQQDVLGADEQKKNSADNQTTTSTSSTTASTQPVSQPTTGSEQGGEKLPEINPLPKEVANDPINPRIGKYLTDGNYYVTNNRKNGQPVVKQWDAANNEFKLITDPKINAQAQSQLKPEVPLAQEQPLLTPKTDEPSNNKQSALPFIETRGISIYDKRDKISDNGVVTAGIVQSMASQPQVVKYMQLKNLYNTTADEPTKEKIATEMDAIKSAPFQYEEQNTPVDNLTAPISLNVPLQPSIPKDFKTVADAIKYTQDQVDEGQGLQQEYADRTAQLKEIKKQYDLLKPEAPQSFFYEAAHAIEAHGKALHNSNFLATASDEDAMKFLEDNYKKQQVFPEAEPEGFLGNLGEIAGGAAATVPAIATTATAATTMTGNPLIGALAGGLYAAQDMGRVAYANGLQQQYNQLRDKGTLSNLAFNDAKEYAKNSAGIQGALGLSMGMIGAGETTKIVAETSKQLLKQVFADVSKKAITDYTLGASGQMIDNYEKEKFGVETNIFDGANKQGAILAGQSLLVHLLTGGIPTMSKYISLKNIEDAKNSLALTDAAQLSQIYNNTANTGGDKNAVEQLKQDVEQRRIALSAMPSGLSVEKKLELMPLVKRKMELIQQMTNKVFPDQHAISEIEKIDRKLNEEAGVPLTQKEHEKYWDLRNQAKEDGKLSQLKREELNHLEKRRSDAYDKKRIENLPTRNVGQEKLPLIEVEEDRLRLPKGTKYVTADDVTHIRGEKTEREITNKVTPEANFRTMNMGKDEGQPETPEARKIMKERFVDGNIPVDGEKGDGESGKNFVSRVITAWEKVKNEPKNITVVTHSSVLKAIKTWENPATWENIEKPTDPSKMTDEQWKKYANAYIKESTDNGDLETFKGKNGDVHVIRHGQTEDNKQSKFRSGNTPLTEKGIEQAKQSGDELQEKTDGDVPKIISSDLPRAIHTSNLITDQLKPSENANTTGSKEATDNQGSNGQIQSDGDDREHTPKEQKEGDGNGGSDSTQQGKEKIDNSKTTGISHATQTERTSETKQAEPLRGEGLSAEEAIQLGRDLIKKGADPEQVAADFKKNGTISAELLSIVRAKHEDLVRETNRAEDLYGENSSAYKNAATKETEWYDNVVRPMKTEWHKIGKVQQGEVDIDTGTFAGIRRSFNQEHGGEMSPKQVAEAKQLVDTNQKLAAENEALKKQLTDAIEKKVAEAPKETASGKYAEKAKIAADKIRKLKTKPFIFTDSKGNKIEFKQNSIIPYNDIIEGIATLVEKGGKVADSVKEILDKYKDEDWYSSLSPSDKNTLHDQFAEHLSDSEDNIHTQFVDKTDNEFTPQEVKDIWDYAKKEYLDGGAEFGNMVHGVAMDLGLTQEQVLNAISQPKGAKNITDAMYINQAKRNKAVQNAKEWVKTAGQANDSPVRKAMRMIAAIPDFVFGLKIFGHGTVAPITHAGMDLFQPSGWKNYFKFFLEGFKNAYGNRAAYEKRMADLKADPMYPFAKRNGLAVDPDKRYDDYQQNKSLLDRMGKAGKLVKAGTEVGDRGFNALKTYRLAKFKQLYNGLSDIEKSDPNTAKELAKIVNHSTGTSDFGIKNETANKVLSTLTFAPKLEASRWARLFVEPSKAIATFSNWGNSKPSEQAAAKIVAKRSGEMLATYSIALAANAGILALTGSNQKINVTDPSASDWMKFKGFDKTFDFTGGMRSTTKFVADLLKTGIESAKSLHGKSRSDKAFSTVGSYARGKLSPFASTAFDFMTHKDFVGNTLPPYADKPSKGKERLSWSQYLLDNQTPLPIGEGIKAMEESMKEKGMDEADVTDVLTGILSGAISGGTGARMSPDHTIKKEESKTFQPDNK